MFNYFLNLTKILKEARAKYGQKQHQYILYKIFALKNNNSA